MTTQSHPGSEDAFGSLSEFGTKSNSKKKNINSKKTTTRTDLAGLDSNTSTGTKINVGKKLTGTYDFQESGRVKDTTLNGMSIETDQYKIDSPAEKPDNKRLTRTTIDASTVFNPSPKKDSEHPVVVEDSKAETNSGEKPPLESSHRKDRKHPQPISVDISSRSIRRLPPENESIPLGSGIITGLLGSGGMAKVYKIWNEELEVFRAVKVLLPSSQQEVKNRFQTEVKISAKLNHPNIVRVFSVGRWNGLPYMEMEMIEGITLSSIISRFKTIPSSVCAALALQISHALAYAHSQEVLIYGKKYSGIIHRDLKPSNIMVNNQGVVKLMDFGVARPVETGLHTVNTTNLVGTLQYFSPEQIAGYPIDQSSDIYSFGAVLYEMLCGSCPFPQNKMVELIQAKTNNRFTRLEDYGQNFDSRLSSVVQICLRTDKHSRFDDSFKLRSCLDEIHRSFQTESPEEVIKSFMSDPEKVYKEDEKRCTLYRSKTSTKSALAHAHTTGSDVDSDTELYGVSTPAVIEKQEIHETLFDIEDSEQTKNNRNRVVVVVILILLIVLLGLILFFKKMSQQEESVMFFEQYNQYVHSLDLTRDMRGFV
ncbi:MAG: serine/threonine-protein kinase [Fibrobacterota bacterium]